jgi:hypothetical protein
MSHPYQHALSSAKRFGGTFEEYLLIHMWFDASKELMCDPRHRALRHHAQGIFEAERVFGTTITNSQGRQVPVRLIGEQHVREDLGFIPSVEEWFRHIQLQPWMHRGVDRRVNSLSLDDLKVSSEG